MGIIKRFANIMACNFNSLLEKSNNPEKMIVEYLRQIESDLGSIKAETSSVLAEEKRTKRVLNECVDEIEKMDRYAERARNSGDTRGERDFLDRKEELVRKEKLISEDYELSKNDSNKMKEL